MTPQFSKRALALLLLAALSAPASALPAPADDAIALTLIGLNDFHGNILPPAGTVLAPDPLSAKGTRVSAGGAAYLSTLVQQIRQENPGNTLVVAAGDMVGASQLTSGLFHDEPTVDVLSQIGLDISSVGNHEFDKGRDELLRLQNGGCFPASPDGKAGVVGVDTCMNQGAFKGASFQYLAANVIDRRTGHTLFPAYAIRELSGVKIGFIGLTLKDTPSMVTPGGVAGLQFEDEVQTVNRLVPQLRAQGVTVIVVLIHQGGQTTARTVLDKVCPGFSGEILDLSDRFDSAVDVVVSGHTHQEYVCFRPDGKLVTQTGFYGRLVSKIDLRVDRASGKVTGKDANNRLVVNDVGVKDALGQSMAAPGAYAPLQPDPRIAEIVRRYGDLTASITDVPVGRIAAALDRRRGRGGESTLGSVIADAFLAASSTDSYGERPAQIAFTNAGGIRSDLSASLGVTFGQLFDVMPFNNNLVTMDLTGAQLLRLLEQQWESPQPQGGRIMPVSQGFSYAWDANAPEGAAPGTGRRVVPGSMRLHGDAVLPERVYRVTVNNFMASGGDLMTVLRDGRNLQAGEVDLVAAKLYFRVRGVVPVPALDRITRLN